MSKNPSLYKNGIKAIIVDVDGTLLSHTKRQIPESARSALALAKEHGILLFIATGRHKKKLDFDPLILSPMFSGHITLNGQFCFSGDRVLLSNPIHKEDIRGFVNFLARQPIPALFYEDDDFFANMIDKSVMEAHASIGMAIPKVDAPERAMESDIFLIDIFGGDKHLHIMQFFKHCVYVPWFWGGGGFDIFPQGGNKWVGILRVLEHFNINPGEAATIGDCENDIEMLVNAGFSVAMGNSSKRVKEYADYVTDDVDEDGLSKAIKRIISI